MPANAPSRTMVTTAATTTRPASPPARIRASVVPPTKSAAPPTAAGGRKPVSTARVVPRPTSAAKLAAKRANRVSAVYVVLRRICAAPRLAITP